jgi:hypothetical protein
VDYAIHPRFISIMKENSFAGDDPDENHYSHLHSFTALSWYRICPTEKIDNL